MLAKEKTSDDEKKRRLIRIVSLIENDTILF